jgi:predicted Zn-dependent protease
MKNLIRLSSVLFVVLFVLGCDRKISLTKFNCQADVHTHNSCGHSCRHHSYDNISNVDNNNFPKRHIVVSSLGYVNQSDIDYAIKVIKDFYGYDCSIGSSMSITNDMYLNGTSVIDADFTIEKLEKFDPSYKTVYIVDKELYADGKSLRGYAVRNGKSILVIADKSILRETLIHEIGHSLGLAHCDDLTCVMAVKNDEYDKGTFCNKCFNKLGVVPANVVINETPTINTPSNIGNNFFTPDVYER